MWILSVTALINGCWQQLASSRTHLFRLTMAQGIPVGVLKAGSSFSANCTAFSLKTYEDKEMVKNWLILRFMTTTRFKQ